MTTVFVCPGTAADTEDAYLRCVKCGHMLPILHTPADEPCDMCGGFMAYAIGEWD